MVKNSLLFVTFISIAAATTAVNAGFSHEIMFVGDSITEGQDSTQGGGNGNGYRGYLYDGLVGVGDTPTFVGSADDAGLPTTTPGGDPFSHNHNGYSGKKMRDETGNILDFLQADDPFGAGGLTPDIVILMGGTNDVLTSSFTPNAFKTGLEDTLDYLFANNTGLHVVISTITPLDANRPDDPHGSGKNEAERIDELNAALLTVFGSYSAANGGTFSVFDSHTVLDANIAVHWSALTPHPSNLGYELLADGFLSHLQSEGLAMPEPGTLALLGMSGLIVLRRRRVA